MDLAKELPMPVGKAWAAGMAKAWVEDMAMTWTVELAKAGPLDSH